MTRRTVVALALTLLLFLFAAVILDVEPPQVKAAKGHYASRRLHKDKQRRRYTTSTSVT